MRPRFLVLAWMLVVLPTAWLTFLAARAIRDRDVAARHGTERAAAAALDEVDRAVGGQLARELELVRVAVSASLAASGSMENLGEAARRLRRRPLIGAVHVFMNPWGFVYPPEEAVDAVQRPLTNDAPSPPSVPPAASLADALRHAIASLGDSTQPICFALAGRHYAFVLLRERKSLCAGFEASEDALREDVLRPLLRMHTTRLFTVHATLPGLTPMDAGVPPGSGKADDGVVMTDSLTSRRQRLTPPAAPALPIVSRPLGAPFGDVFLQAFAREGGEGARAGVLQAQLYAWGIALLAAGILAGMGVVLAGASAEIRRARRQSDFMAGISHDLRTPLASIRMLAESLHMGTVRETERARFLDLIVQESDRLAKLVDRVMFLVRYTQGASLTARHLLDARRLVDQAISVFARGRVSGIACRVTGDADGGWRLEGGESAAAPGVAPPPSGALPSAFVEGDEAVLTQVLLNLLDNAVKYGRSADGAVDVRVWVDAVAVRRWRVLPRRRWVRIAVRDAGPGLSRRDLRRVFRRFYRGAGAQALNVSGTGLGLAVCRHVVRAHGGWIGASSAPGQGSTFSVYLPARDQRTVGPDKRGRRMKQAGPVGALWATRMAAVTTTIGKHLTGL